jgi:hypothetical protein
MESLLTLPIGDYRAVELTLRLMVALIVMTSLLQILCLSVVEHTFRFPLILVSVALLGAGWFEAGVWIAWKEAFELAGASYCVTGHLLAGEDRIIAWSLGSPAILIGFGLLFLNTREKVFRNLCGAALVWVVLGPFFQIVSLISFVLCALQFRGILTISSKKQGVPREEILVAITSMALGFIVTELGYFHLLPLGKLAEVNLIRGEMIHSLCDLLALVVPGAALLIGVLRISRGNPQGA